jgi:hypothetical protein
LTREERIGLNEALFREVNERIDALGDKFDTPGLEIVCECGELDCSERFEMDAAAYQEMRSDDRLFALIPGHETPDVEDVVQETPAYFIVRKHSGRPAEVAEQTAP